MKKTKKNISKKTNIDPIFEARKNRNFEKYSQEASMKARIAEEVFAAREKKGLSQQNLAKIVGTTQRIISSMENGDLNPGSFLLFRVGKALDFNSHNFAKINDCPESFKIMSTSTGVFKTYITKNPMDLSSISNTINSNIKI
jgi:ribosome-binding protein aMBF1 (putative translation factor)